MHDYSVRPGQGSPELAALILFTPGARVDETAALSDAKINFPKNVPGTLKRHTRYIEDYFCGRPRQGLSSLDEPVDPHKTKPIKGLCRMIAQAG